MKNEYLSGTLSPVSGGKALRYKKDFKRAHPEYFDPDGLLVFCGPQGSGKTLSAVQYCKKLLEHYPSCKFVTNVAIEGLPEHTEVIEYNGLETLMDVSNGYAGVLYLIDELHLEFNSLESKSISIEEMTEFAQQRKDPKRVSTYIAKYLTKEITVPKGRKRYWASRGLQKPMEEFIIMSSEEYGEIYNLARFQKVSETPYGTYVMCET